MIECIIHEPTTEGLRDSIRILSEHYSKKQQWKKAREEVRELKDELARASNPFGYEDLVYFTDNTWSEIADVIIRCAQLAMQHNAEDKVLEQMEYKVTRQLERISREVERGENE